MATPETAAPSAPPRSASSPASTPTTRRSSASTIPRPATPTSRPRASPARSSSRSPSTRTSRSGCATSGSRRYEHFEQPPDPAVGRQPQPDRLRRHPLLRPRLGEEQPRLVRGPRGHQEHLRPPRHPRGRAQVPLRRRRPVRVRGRLPPGEREARGAGRDLHRHGHRPPRARGPGPRVLGDDHPAQRQQARRAQLGRLVGRLVRLRPGRRLGRDAAAGLLPDQHREHGPVRADADHRRGGLGRPLHRGLHRAGLLDRLAALRGGRDRRQAKAPGSATRPSRTGRRTSTTSSPSGRSPTRTRRWSGSTATSARS